MDGYTDKSTVNHFINFASEAGAAIDKEMTEMKDNQCLVVLPLSKALSESALEQIREKYSDLNVSYIN